LVGYVEFAIPRSDLASPTALGAIGSLIAEAMFSESTYAFVPPTTPSGYDPDPVDFLPLALYQSGLVPSLGSLGLCLIAAALGALGVSTLRRA
jgi:hypothetical protein